MASNGLRRSRFLRFTGYVVLASIFAAACFFLSQWQFARRNEAAAQIEHVARNFDSAPVALDTFQASHVFASEFEWKPVIVSGTYVTGCDVWVRNRVRNGEAGFEAVSCLRTSAGTVILVNRGWVPSTKGGLPAESGFKVPEGRVDVVMRMRTMERVISGQSAAENLIPSINPSFFGQLKDIEISPFYGDLVSETSDSPHGQLQEKPVITEGNHLSYALQWIAFAVLGFVAVAWIIRHENKISGDSPPTSKSSRPHSHATRRPSRRADLDAAHEDSLLDEL